MSEINRAEFDEIGCIRNRPRLSILIPSTPSRFDMTIALYKRLEALTEGMDVEILCLFDNKKRSIGAKRNALKDIAIGHYFMFCDSDDDFVSIKEIYEAAEITTADVICFKAECTNEDGSTYIVDQQLGHEVEHNTLDGRYLDCKRPPFQNCAWNLYYTQFDFADVNYSEDWHFIKRCLRDAGRQIYIDKVLYKYNFNPTITEASTESNEFWTNPNHDENSN